MHVLPAVHIIQQRSANIFFSPKMSSNFQFSAFFFSQPLRPATACVLYGSERSRGKEFKKKKKLKDIRYFNPCPPPARRFQRNALTLRPREIPVRRRLWCVPSRTAGPWVIGITLCTSIKTNLSDSVDKVETKWLFFLFKMVLSEKPFE